MPGITFPFVFAVHLSDGILTWPWWVGGLCLAVLLGCLGAWRIRDEEIPRVALMTAAFFVASLIHVRLPPASSVHLLLNGLVGVTLGRRVTLAIPVGLFLQAALLGHGGFQTLGVNSCVMVLPALVSWLLFQMLHRLPSVREVWFRAGLVVCSSWLWILCAVFGIALLLNKNNSGVELASGVILHPATLIGSFALSCLAAWAERYVENGPEFPIGLLIGQLSVILTVALNVLVLAWGAPESESWDKLAQIVFVAHLPIALLEGIVLGFTVSFLARVKPEMLGWDAMEKIP